MTPTSIHSTCRPLRILIVDDNHINLSVLSTLLKRRFSHLIDGAPVSVDSGLKAIQLLRTHIFDCIFMDIQMPFLSGLEASRRIRNAEDGILPANSDAHIVAVTTAIGDEPELAYRRTRMDGMIGKPVRYNQLQQYLLPLALEAYKAGLTVPPLNIDGEDVMPPLPPASEYERVFHLPADAVTPSTRPDICEGSDFERLLNNQTRASLRRYDIATPASTELLLAPILSPDVDTTLVEEDDHESTSTLSSRRGSSNNMEKLKQSTPPVSSPSKNNRSGSAMTISKRMLSKQIQREVDNADLESESQVGHIARSTTSTLRRIQSRPQVMHRNSSPGWLLDAAPSSNMIRPTLSSLLRTQDQQSRSPSGAFSESSEDSVEYPGLRRVSETSSGSTTSDSSSVITTPACDSPVNFWSLGATHPFGFAKAHERTLSNRTANQNGSLGSNGDVRDSWSSSSETAAADSSPTRNKTNIVGMDSGVAVEEHTSGHLRHFASLQDLAQSVGQLDLAAA
jgi:CheY-like chemotaxis protein